MLSPDKLRAQLEAQAEAPAEQDLPPLTVIDIDVEGTRGKRYAGRFVFKVPSLGDQIKIGQMKSVYLPQGAASDPNAMLLVEQICFLEVTLQMPRPEWYRPLEMMDASPISVLYGRALDYERRFHGANANGRTDQAEPPRTEGSAGSGDAALGRKVQPPAQRRETLVDNDKGGV